MSTASYVSGQHMCPIIITMQALTKYTHNLGIPSERKQSLEGKARDAMAALSQQLQDVEKREYTIK